MAVAEAWETVQKAIEAYTGLSPAIFFTVLAIAWALYHSLVGFLAPPPPPPRSREREEEPLPPPLQLGEITEEELRVYDGSDPKKPLLMAIKAQIYDVTQSRMFYGPGGPYALFAGKDASRALAKMSFEPTDLTSDISDLGPFELEALQDWEYKFMSKYVKVGTVKKAVPESSDCGPSEVTEGTQQDVSSETGVSRELPAETKEADLDAEPPTEKVVKSDHHEVEQLAEVNRSEADDGHVEVKELGSSKDAKD
ncbi:membrane steroid-binding protein 1-like [Zingiber officinale]|nr:membrane steroid-binding protein 1-like [Zingiber officinale]